MQVRLRNTSLNNKRVAVTLLPARRDSGKDSGTHAHAMHSSTATASVPTMGPCHPIACVSAPPAIGVTMGNRPLNTLINASVLIKALPWFRSLAIERAMTMPPPAARPCSTRTASSTGIDVASRLAADATASSAIDTNSGVRRPRRSVSGPMMTWPSASPSRLAVSPSWAVVASMPNAVTSAGMAGENMLLTTDARAVSVPSTDSR